MPKIRKTGTDGVERRGTITESRFHRWWDRVRMTYNLEGVQYVPIPVGDRGHDEV